MGGGAFTGEWAAIHAEAISGSETPSPIPTQATAMPMHLRSISWPNEGARSSPAIRMPGCWTPRSVKTSDSTLTTVHCAPDNPPPRE